MDENPLKPELTEKIGRKNWFWFGLVFPNYWSVKPCVVGGRRHSCWATFVVVVLSFGDWFLFFLVECPNVSGWFMVQYYVRLSSPSGELLYLLNIYLLFSIKNNSFNPKCKQLQNHQGIPLTQHQNSKPIPPPTKADPKTDTHQTADLLAKLGRQSDTDRANQQCLSQTWNNQKPTSRLRQTSWKDSVVDTKHLRAGVELGF